MTTVTNAEPRNFAVGAVIIDRSADPAKFLILRRNDSDFMGGIDELPSGKAEGAESLINALKREVKEETYLKIEDITGYLGSFQYPDAGGKMRRQFNFAVTVKPGRVKLSSDEHSGFKWVGSGDLADTRLTENVRELVTKHRRILELP